MHVRNLVHRRVAAAALSIAAAVLIAACSSPSTSVTAPSALAGSTAAADSGLKGVICHATGSSSNPYTGVIVGLQDSTIDPLNPIFSNNGHLDANGSPFDGHEHDIYIGPNPPNEKRDCDKLPPPK